MAAGGFCRLPNGRVVVALNLPDLSNLSNLSNLSRVPSQAVPDAAGPAAAAPDATTGVRVLVHAHNRARALTRLRNLGLRAVYLRGNAAPPTPDEITAVLHHPDGLIWRTTRETKVLELWRPIRSLLRDAAA